MAVKVDLDRGIRSLPDRERQVVGRRDADPCETRALAFGHLSDGFVGKPVSYDFVLQVRKQVFLVRIDTQDHHSFCIGAA